MTVWLRDEGGARLALVGGSLVLGRSNACHVVLDDPTVSRQHAIIVEVDGGARVVPLGRAGVRVRGAQIDEPALALHGDVLEIARSRFTFEIQRPREPARWHLELGGRRYPVRAAPPFRVGGDSADLSLPGWPDPAITLYPTPSALLAELHAAITVGGSKDHEGEALVRLSTNATLAFGGVTLRVVQADDAPATLDLTAAPTHASLELMPNGALLTLTAEKVYAVWPCSAGETSSPPCCSRRTDCSLARMPDEVPDPRSSGGASTRRGPSSTR
ncbi:MAG: FHA domain-containing protein [Polyangiaceae bacterium]